MTSGCDEPMDFLYTSPRVYGHMSYKSLNLNKIDTVRGEQAISRLSKYILTLLDNTFFLLENQQITLYDKL